MDFEWDNIKNAINIRKHGVAFEDAARVFKDPWRVERYDKKHSADEDRWIGIGLVWPRILFVVYAIKDRDTYRIISARKANEQERREYCDL